VPINTYEKQWIEEPYSEGIARHSSPESCEVTLESGASLRDSRKKVFGNLHFIIPDCGPSNRPKCDIYRPKYANMKDCKLLQINRLLHHH
jgi:hypothetical protein